MTPTVPTPPIRPSPFDLLRLLRLVVARTPEQQLAFSAVTAVLLGVVAYQRAARHEQQRARSR